MRGSITESDRQYALIVARRCVRFRQYHGNRRENVEISVNMIGLELLLGRGASEMLGLGLPRGHRVVTGIVIGVIPPAPWSCCQFQGYKVFSTHSQADWKGRGATNQGGNAERNSEEWVDNAFFREPLLVC